MMDTLSPTVSLACELMSRQSVTPNDGGCQQYLAEKLHKLGFNCESMRFDNVDNLWARLGTEGPLFVFAGHTDVVPTGPESAWTSPPFQPEIRNGYLFGRGACDMKTQIASMVIAMQNFLQKNKSFKGSLGLLITSDEEGIAINGTKKVIDELTRRGEMIDYCIVGEPSSDKQVGDQIRVGRRGSLHGRLVVNGKQGHVAHPHLAINPIHSTAPALHELATEKWDNGNEDFPETTFQITNIHAGTGANNVIPGMIEVIFNFRFSSAITIDELKHRTQSILDRHNLNFVIDWTVGAKPFLTKKDKLVEATKKAIKQTVNLEPHLSTGGGTSDGRFIAPTGAELLELGVSHATAHQIDENVLVSDLEKLTEIYQLILEDLFD